MWVALLFLFASQHQGSAQCSPNEIELDIQITEDDNFASDNTHWELINNDGSIFSSGTNGTSLCVPTQSCFTFKIYDDFGNGLAGNPAGNYAIYYNDDLVNSGINFGTEKSVLIGNCIEGSACNFAIELIEEGVYKAPNPDTWYVFTPEESGQYTISSCDLGNNCNIAVWGYNVCDGVVDNENQEEGVFFANGGCEEIGQVDLNTFLLGGTTYYIRIGDLGINCGNNHIDWELIFLGPVEGCTDLNACNYDPMASIDDGSCIESGADDCPEGPDLVVDEFLLQNSLFVESFQNSDNCYVSEGCIKGYGDRDVLRFSTKIANIGTQDFFVGETPNDPTQEDAIWEWDECHEHWHYEGYAEYLLFDQNGQSLPVGFKNGFCVIDLGCEEGALAKYNCNNQGITAGCYDIYDASLDCQWVDITGLEEGEYTLVVRVNWDQSPDALGREEVTYENNWAQTCFYLGKNPDGSLFVNSLANCETYTDCLGNPLGDAQIDCQGICNGGAMPGDMNLNGLYDLSDIDTYIDGILYDYMEAETCNELSSDGVITLLDPALIVGCILSSEEDVHNHAHTCDFPYLTIENPNQEAVFSIGAFNPVVQYFDIYLKNPFANLSGFNLQLDDVIINEVVSLTDFSPVLYHDGYAEIVGLATNGIPSKRFASSAPFLRVYYDELKGEGNACITEVITVVNNNNELIQGAIENGCIENASDANDCDGTQVTLLLTPDIYGSEISWELKQGATVLYAGDDYPNQNTNTILEDFCLAEGCYEFSIVDGYGDGICCTFSNGNYSLSSLGENIIESDGTYGSGETTTFCVEAAGSNIGIKLGAKAFLQGAMISSTDETMRTDLNDMNLLPQKEPYTDLTYFEHQGGGGNELASDVVMSQSGMASVVDWLLLEIRLESNPSKVIATQSVLLQKDGTIVNKDGNSTIDFGSLPEGKYYIALRHRNHLGAMTANAINLSSQVQFIDFTQGDCWGQNAMVQLLNGSYAMWAGNAQSDSQLIFQGANNEVNGAFFEILSDAANTSFTSNYIVTAYSQNDIDMDGQVIYQGTGNDPNSLFFNILGHPNNVNAQVNFIIEEQLPENPFSLQTSDNTIFIMN